MDSSSAAETIWRNSAVKNSALRSILPPGRDNGCLNSQSTATFSLMRRIYTTSIHQRQPELYVQAIKKQHKHTILHFWARRQENTEMKGGEKESKKREVKRGNQCHPKSCWLRTPPRSTHHRPGLPLAVSQKKWLKRSLVLKLLSMVSEWEHETLGQSTHDCGREPLIPRHMTCSPIIP